MNNDNTKVCTKCKIEKNFSEFNKRSASKDGLQHKCKSCESIYYKSNSEKILSRQRLYELENKIKVAEKKHKYHLKNKDLINARHRENYLLNKPAIQAKHSEWKSKNKEKVSNYLLKRRTLKKNNGVYKIRNSFLKKLYNSSCIVCGDTNDIEADHIIPIARGGTHSEGNLQPLCGICNPSKGISFMMEWRMRRPDLFAEC